MKRTSSAFAALSLVLAACVASQSHPLSVSATEGRALFASITQCAAERKIESVQHQDSVNVRATPGAWAQFMAQGSQFNLVVVVEDQTGGPQAMQDRATAAKKLGDEVFACAVALGPKAPPPSASATVVAQGPTAPTPPTPPDPGTTPGATTTPAAPAASAGTPAATPAASGTATLGGTGKNPMDGFGKALGGAFGAMTDCTKLTACRTQLSGEVCLATDKACLDAINGGDSGGPSACGKNLARVREAAEKYKKRPDWKLPPQCQ